MLNLLNRLARFFVPRPPVVTFRGRRSVTFNQTALIYPSGSLNTLPESRHLLSIDPATGESTFNVVSGALPPPASTPGKTGE